MPLSLVQVVAPALEPVSLDALKLHLRLDTDAQDTLLAVYLAAAREYVERWTGRQLLTALYTLTLERWPHAQGFALPRPPLQAVTGTYTDAAAVVHPLGITYVDGAGVTQTWDPSAYWVDTASEPGRVLLGDLASWPVLGAVPQPVRVTYTAGYGPSGTAVPAALKAAILLGGADLFEHAESQSEVRLEENMTVQRLLWSYRLVECG